MARRPGYDHYAEYRKHPSIAELGLTKEKEECAVRLLEAAEEVNAKFEKAPNPPPVFLNEFINQFVLPALKVATPTNKWISVSGPVGKETRKEYFSAFTENQLKLRYAMIRQFQDAANPITDHWLDKRLFIIKKAYYPTEDEAEAWGSLRLSSSNTRKE